MYRADHVSYRTNAYWAVANTGAVSLERWPLSSYGNDPVSWRASFVGGSPGFVLVDTYPMGTTIQLTGGSPIIAFEAILGESYEVRYTDSLIDPDWQVLAAIPSASTEWIEVLDTSSTNSTRYYRIIWDW